MSGKGGNPLATMMLALADAGGKGGSGQREWKETLDPHNLGWSKDASLLPRVRTYVEVVKKLELQNSDKKHDWCTMAIGNFKPRVLAEFVKFLGRFGPGSAFLSQDEDTQLQILQA